MRTLRSSVEKYVLEKRHQFNHLLLEEEKTMVWVKVLSIALAVIGTGVAVAEFARGGQETVVVQEPEATVLVPEDSRFYCEQHPDLDRGGVAWTVMYDSGEPERVPKPWLRMIRAMGNGWDTSERCQAIADRMNDYREDGLLALEIRDDAATPRQSVICAKTVRSSNGCPLVLTLMPEPEDDPNQAIRDVLKALLPGEGSVYQCSEPGNCRIEQPLTISLQGHL